MTKIWLVTGGSGFLGGHILDAIASRPTAGDYAVGIGRRPPEVARGVFVTLDLDSRDEILNLVSGLSPSVVIHAAGRTPPGASEEYYRANTLSTLHLLTALKAIGRPVRIVLVGSAAELGPVPIDRLPVGEDEPCRPSDSYGLSKFLATMAGIACPPPLEVISARVFNPVGPGMPAGQALGKFVQNLATEDDGPIRIDVGDLDARRDFIDVRDVASAIVALALRGKAGEIYNVGTGRSRRVGDGLAGLIALSGRDVEVVQNRSVPHGPADSRADIRKIVADTGWSPRIPWEQTLSDLWDAAMSRSVAIDLISARP